MVFEMIFDQIVEIFGTSFSFSTLANEIMAYVVTTLFFVIFLFIPVAILFTCMGWLSPKNTGQPADSWRSERSIRSTRRLRNRERHSRKWGDD